LQVADRPDGPSTARSGQPLPGVRRGGPTSCPVPSSPVQVDPVSEHEQAAMSLALDEARAAAAAGDVPVGAVVLVDGAVVAQRGNQREQFADPTAHAELLALRDAAAALGTWRLAQATLVVTLEP